MNNKKGFTLVELMVVVAIIAILAAVALPMYSTFKQKSRVATATKALEGIKTALQGWYEDTRDFSTIDTVPADGGSVKAGARNVGAGLPQIEGLAWSLAGATSSEIQINFSWTANCPPANCDGKWRIRCYPNNDLCTVAQEVGGTTDPLNYNFQPVDVITFQ